jgi:hypothetical protein
MATRSHIGIRNDDNTVSYVYCHWDGYPEHNGKILLNHYNNKEIINTLLNNGNMSILGEQIDPSPDSPHTFSGKRQDNVCIFYFRERNEMGNEKKIVSGDIEYKMSRNDCDYQYLFDNGQWKYRNGHSEWFELTPQVCKIS